jgi:hypothetical protein
MKLADIVKECSRKYGIYLIIGPRTRNAGGKPYHMLEINLIDLTNHSLFPRLPRFGLHLGKGCP